MLLFEACRLVLLQLGVNVRFRGAVSYRIQCTARGNWSTVLLHRLGVHRISQAA